MNIESFIENFADALDIDELGNLNANTNLKEDIENWDSLGALNLIAMLDTEYEVEISGEELESVKTIGELFNLVQERLK